MRKQNALFDQVPNKEDTWSSCKLPSLSLHRDTRMMEVQIEAFNELVKKLSSEPFRPDKVSITLAVEPRHRCSIVKRFKWARRRYQDLLKQVDQVRGYRYTACYELSTKRSRRSRARRSTLTLSVAPFGDRAFVRIDFNPTKLRKAGRATARRIIRQILGMTCFNLIWQHARVTKLEAAKTYAGVSLDDMLFYKKGSKVVEAFMGGSGALSGEGYLRANGRGGIVMLRMNSLESRFYSKAYDPDAWLCKSIRLVKIPRFRLELVVRHTRLPPACLAQLQIPIRSILVFNRAVLDQIFDDPSLRPIRPFFVAACRWFGFQNAVALLPRRRKAMLLGKLERDVMQVTALHEQWRQQWPTVVERAFRFLRPVATRSKRTP